MVPRWAYLSVVPLQGQEEGAAQQQQQQMPSFQESSITKPRHRIGRDARCETALERFTVVSSEHCFITTEFECPETMAKGEGTCVLRARITDNSTNGTLVNKRVLKRGETMDLADLSEISMRGKATPFKFVFHLVPLSSDQVKQLAQASKHVDGSTASLLPSPVSANSASMRQRANSPVASEELAALRHSLMQAENALERETRAHEETRRAHAVDLEQRKKSLAILHEDLGKRERERRALETSLAEVREMDAVQLEQVRVELQEAREEGEALGAKVQDLNAKLVQSERTRTDALLELKLAGDALLSAQREASAGEARMREDLLLKQNLVQELVARNNELQAAHDRFQVQMEQLESQVQGANEQVRAERALREDAQSELQQVKLRLEEVEREGSLLRKEMTKQFQIEREELEAAHASAQSLLQTKLQETGEERDLLASEVQSAKEIASVAERKLDEMEAKLKQERNKTLALQCKAQENAALRAQAETLAHQAKLDEERLRVMEDAARMQAEEFALREDELKRASLAAGNALASSALECKRLEALDAQRRDALCELERVLTGPVLSLIRDALPARAEDLDQVVSPPSTPKLEFESSPNRANHKRQELFLGTQQVDAEESEEEELEQTIKRQRTLVEEDTEDESLPQQHHLASFTPKQHLHDSMLDMPPTQMPLVCATPYAAPVCTIAAAVTNPQFEE